MSSMDEEATAWHFAARLWLAVQKSRLKAEEPQVFRRVFESEYLEGVSLPLDRGTDTAEGIALASPQGFDRPVGKAALARANEEMPRTRVYEGMDMRHPGWHSLTAIQLANLARHGVSCSMYESNSGNANLGPHTDTWLGVIVQMRGEKDWHLFREGGPVEETRLTRGDVLVLPAGVRHDVSTPHYSVHLLFPFITTEVIG